LTGLYALESTPLVTTRWLPSTFHAKAYLRTEETRNLNIHFVDSRVFRRGRMSNTYAAREHSFRRRQQARMTAVSAWLRRQPSSDTLPDAAAAYETERTRGAGERDAAGGKLAAGPACASDATANPDGEETTVATGTAPHRKPRCRARHAAATGDDAGVSSSSSDPAVGDADD